MVGDRDRDRGRGKGCIRVQITRIISYSQYLDVLSVYLFFVCKDVRTSRLLNWSLRL